MPCLARQQLCVKPKLVLHGMLSYKDTRAWPQIWMFCSTTG